MDCDSSKLVSDKCFRDLAQRSFLVCVQYTLDVTMRRLGRWNMPARNHATARSLALSSNQNATHDEGMKRTTFVVQQAYKDVVEAVDAERKVSKGPPLSLSLSLHVCMASAR